MRLFTLCVLLVMVPVSNLRAGLHFELAASAGEMIDGVRYGFIGSPVIANSGEIVFPAASDLGPALFTDQRLVAYPGMIMSDGRALPSLGRAFYDINSAGQVAYVSDTDDRIGFVALDRDWIAVEGENTDIADTVVYGTCCSPQLLNDGTVLFSGSFLLPSSDPKGLGETGYVSSVEGAVLTDGQDFGNDSNVRFTLRTTEDGVLAAGGYLSDDTGRRRLGGVIWVDGEEIVRTGDIIGGVEVDPIFIYDVNSAGTVLFKAEGRAFTQYGRTIELLRVLEDEWVVMGRVPGTFHLGAEQDVVYATQLGHVSTFPDDFNDWEDEGVRGVVINDDIVLMTGDQVDGLMVTDILDLDTNDHGEMAILAKMSDGQNHIIRGFNAAPGDFNGDRALTVLDVDLLSAAIRNNGYDEFFDLNQDGAVDLVDRDAWVRELAQVDYGDTNFDGVFDSRDLVLVLSAGEYDDELTTNSSWSTGDWNGDGEFSSRDLVLAFQSGGYSQSGSPVSVPEPGGLTGVWLGLAGIACLRRQRRVGECDAHRNGRRRLRCVRIVVHRGAPRGVE